MSSKVEAVLIAGPTASGKSALAVALAERLGGEESRADLLPAVAALAAWAEERRRRARRGLRKAWRAFKAVPLPR